MHQCWFGFDHISITHLHGLNSQHHANYIVAAADIENKCLGQLCGVTLISLIYHLPTFTIGTPWFGLAALRTPAASLTNALLAVPYEAF